MDYLFGPIPSRRLGRSLGIDLLPYKTCTLDCVYCECGSTTNCTRKRKEYVPTEEVIAELDQYLSSAPDLDFITFSGSGEPTLHSKIEEIIEFIKTNYSQYKVALLTNATLFTNPQVIEEVTEVDVIVPSLDAVSEAVFQKINNPAPELTSEEVISGLAELRKNYSGQLWLEMFMIPKVNDTGREIELFRETIVRLDPDQVQLNTLDRPGVKSWVLPVSRPKLKTLAIYLGDKAEVIGVDTAAFDEFEAEIKDRIMDLLVDKAMTKQQLAWELDCGVTEISKYITILLKLDLLETKKDRERIIYECNIEPKLVKSS